MGEALSPAPVPQNTAQHPPTCQEYAEVSITPNVSQFFHYEEISMNCAGNCSGWTVQRNTSSKTSQPCQKGWAIPNGSFCTIENAYPSDTGVYWCESPRGERSNSVNVTVTAGSMILESPCLPVTEGDTVTLRCSYKEQDHSESTSNFLAHFFKDDVFLGSEDGGKKVFPAVSKSDEGFYQCAHPSKGKSLQSWLQVKVRVQPTSVPANTPPPPLMTVPKVMCTVMLFLLYFFTMLLCIYTYRRWTRGKNAFQIKCSDHRTVTSNLSAQKNEEFQKKSYRAALQIHTYVYFDRYKYNIKKCNKNMFNKYKDTERQITKKTKQNTQNTVSASVCAKPLFCIFW
ncbi:Fc receptor-like protein 5 isoform X2 [Channa argus]|uniref:Fc receptor-like protein 5 isoform X2 n=1 Tax=Channa argus TaxID=215402 RepID=UPI003521B3DA